MCGSCQLLPRPKSWPPTAPPNPLLELHLHVWVLPAAASTEAPPASSTAKPRRARKGRLQRPAAPAAPEAAAVATAAARAAASVRLTCLLDAVDRAQPVF